MGNCSSLPAENAPVQNESGRDKQPQHVKGTGAAPITPENVAPSKPVPVSPKSSKPESKSDKSPSPRNSTPDNDTSASSALNRLNSGRADATKALADVVPNSKRGDMLKAVPLLRSLTETQRDKLGGLMYERAFKTNETVFNKGDQPDGFYIITEGDVRVCSVKDDGSLHVLATLRNGDYFGETALVNDDLRGASVIADTDINTLFLEKRHFTMVFNAVDVVFAQRRIGVTSNLDVTDSSSGFVVPERTADSMIKSAQIFAMLAHAFNNNPMLGKMGEDQKQAIVENMHRITCKRGDVLITQGDSGAHVFILQVGLLQVDKNNKPVGRMGPGTVFGELAILYNSPRAATVTALEDCVLWVLDRFSFRKIARNIAETTIHKVMSFLAEVPLLRPLSESEREKIAEAVEEVFYPANTTVMCEGDDGDAMYILVKGALKAVKKNATTAGGVVKEYIEPGAYFGELALKDNGEGKRAASVITTTNTTLLKLNRDAFKLLLGPLDELLQKGADRYSDNGEKKDNTQTVVAAVDYNNLVALGTLGKGSFGHVQLVQDKTTQELYALKSVWKSQIVETQQQGHIMSEKRVMEQLQHPFLNTLHGTYRSRNKLHFLLEPCLGGELFTVLRKRKLFPEDAARFYSASVILAFEYMHSKDTIYRDLKPENLMLTAAGYLKVADFGFAKKISGKTWTLCGTPDYLAPEIVASRGHGKGVDWWTLGILIYEMLASYPPFYDDDQINTYHKILECNIRFPSHFTESARALILGLLERRATRRLGVGVGGVDRIRTADWFAPFDWDALMNRSLPAPDYVTPKTPADLKQEPVDRNPQMEFVDLGDGWDLEFGPTVSEDLAY